MSRRPDWPGQIPRDQVLANFRPTVTERHQAKKPASQRWRGLRVGMSERHLVLVRQLPCVIGGETYGIQAHHLKTGPAKGERGAGFRATDRWSLPLFWTRHDDLERLGSRREPAFFHERGLDPYALAAALWANTGDAARMARVIVAHQQEAIRKLALVRRLVREGDLTRAEAFDEVGLGSA